ncbi:MAG: hypothetical protein AAGP08_06000 [Pseudomonadota bacterium]
MAKEYQIGALWIGGGLTYLEQLCLKSFLDVGQHVKLYTYGEVQNVPDGIEIADGNDVIEMKDALRHKRTGSPALQSDLFRYHMLTQNDDIIWADTDAYCVKPFETPNGHFYAWESPHQVNGGVLGLPPDSETLRELMEFTADEYAIPEWLPSRQQAELRAAKEAGTPVHAGELEWGIWGPRAITHFLHKTGEIRFALPREALYPVPFKERAVMVRAGAHAERMITPETYSIHFYGRRMRNRLQQQGGLAPDDSLIGRLLVKHAIEPAGAPLPELPAKPEPLKPDQQTGRGAPNLTDMADARGIDRGAKRHRFTDLYQMLLYPLRTRDLHLALVGLDSNAGQDDQDAWGAQAMTTLEMWREYFPTAKITVLDLAEKLPKRIKGVSYRKTDLEDPEQIAGLIKSPVDVVIDDATHASHHQQNALRALFPKVVDAGLYIIEDLRAQPASLEKQGMVKTSALFQSYLEHGVFDHPDAAAKADLNELRADVSGCFLFQARFQKHRRDQILVLHKR